RYAKAISETNTENIYNILSSCGTANLPTNSFGYGNNNLILTTTTNSNLLSSGRTFEEMVISRLKLLGYDVDMKIGNSGSQIDLAVVHPDNPSKYLLAIECDGHVFHSAKSVKERDVIRPQFLESRGWIVERTWSINWWKDPEKEIKRLQRIIEESRKLS
ncbi:MAG: hypothetical protein M3Z01_02340, partial [Thermoproteota archaeon]|nr:hypothetical protein [Thermoproteota archaeon]